MGHAWRSALGLAALVVSAVMQPVRAQDAVAIIPAELVPAGLKSYLSVGAKGVQIYLCGKADSGWTWTFKAPEADLLDATGNRIGKHYAGPTWEAADGGKVVGALRASYAMPAATNAIPLLLLDVKSREGSGALAQASAIQRILTVGGTAPPAGCDEARAGSELRVPYSATYVFLK